MKNNKTIVGIDPGHKGAIAIFSEGDLDVWDMKTFRASTGGFNSLDPLKLDSMLGGAISDPYNTVVYCEESILIHGNGIKTSRPIFDSRGVLRAVFALHKMEVKYIAPATWKRFYGLLKADKAASVEKAVELLPDYSDFFRKTYRGRVLDLDGRAEAALIGLYGSENHHD